MQMAVSGSRPLSVLSRAAMPQQQHPGSSCKCRHFRATSVAAEKDDYYELLGISREASASEVKKAYYKAAKKYHPDTNKGDENAAKKFAAATEAYEVLSDAGQKQKYDAYGHGGGGGQAGGFGGGGNPFGGFGGGNPFGGFGGGQSPEDIFAQFDQMFSDAGRRQRGPRGPARGQDVQAQVSLDFLQAVSGCKKTVAWRSPTSGEREEIVDIPAGVDSGMNLRLQGKGETGKGGNGTLYVVINVRDHPVFERDGNDVHVKVRVSTAEAALGSSVRVPTVDGPVTLKVPAATQPGDRRLMQGRGVPDVNGRGKGHQYVHFQVKVPQNLTAKQRELFEALKEEDSIPDDERCGADPGEK